MDSDERMKGMVLALLVFGIAFFFVSGIVNNGNVVQFAISPASPANLGSFLGEPYSSL